MLRLPAAALTPTLTPQVLSLTVPYADLAALPLHCTQARGLLRRYKYFIFLNSSVRGPFVPTYMPPQWQVRAAGRRVLHGSGVRGSTHLLQLGRHCVIACSRQDLAHSPGLNALHHRSGRAPTRTV